MAGNQDQAVKAKSNTTFESIKEAVLKLEPSIKTLMLAGPNFSPGPSGGRTFKDLLTLHGGRELIAEENPYLATIERFLEISQPTLDATGGHGNLKHVNSSTEYIWKRISHGKKRKTTATTKYSTPDSAEQSTASIIFDNCSNVIEALMRWDAKKAKATKDRDEIEAKVNQLFPDGIQGERRNLPDDKMILYDDFKKKAQRFTDKMNENFKIWIACSMKRVKIGYGYLRLEDLVYAKRYFSHAQALLTIEEGVHSIITSYPMDPDIAWWERSYSNEIRDFPKTKLESTSPTVMTLPVKFEFMTAYWKDLNYVYNSDYQGPVQEDWDLFLKGYKALQALESNTTYTEEAKQEMQSDIDEARNRIVTIADGAIDYDAGMLKDVLTKYAREITFPSCEYEKKDGITPCNAAVPVTPQVVTQSTAPVPGPSHAQAPTPAPLSYAAMANKSQTSGPPQATEKGKTEATRPNVAVPITSQASGQNNKITKPHTVQASDPKIAEPGHTQAALPNVVEQTETQSALPTVAEQAETQDHGRNQHPLPSVTMQQPRGGAETETSASPQSTSASQGSARFNFLSDNTSNQFSFSDQDAQRAQSSQSHHQGQPNQSLHASQGQMQASQWNMTQGGGFPMFASTPNEPENIDPFAEQFVSDLHIHTDMQRPEYNQLQLSTVTPRTAVMFHQSGGEFIPELVEVANNITASAITRNRGLHPQINRFPTPAAFHPSYQMVRPIIEPNQQLQTVQWRQDPNTGAYSYHNVNRPTTLMIRQPGSQMDQSFGYVQSPQPVYSPIHPNQHLPMIPGPNQGQQSNAAPQNQMFFPNQSNQFMQSPPPAYQGHQGVMQQPSNRPLYPPGSNGQYLHAAVQGDHHTSFGTQSGQNMQQGPHPAMGHPNQMVYAQQAMNQSMQASANMQHPTYNNQAGNRTGFVGQNLPQQQSGNYSQHNQ